MPEPRDTTGTITGEAELERVTTMLDAYRSTDAQMVARMQEMAAELERVTTERDDAYALIRHYADTDPEVALAERMRPVVEAAKACADCDCESPRHDDDGNLFLPKGGYPCAWDCPHLEGLLDAVDAFRVATSEQEASDCTTCGGTGEEEFAIPGTDHDTMMGDCTDCKASEQEASGHAS